MGKELILKALRHEDVERAPWVPFAGIHSGKLLGYNAIEVLTDGKKLFECLSEVNRLYAPDGQPVIFDLQVEAEILGCELSWVENSPPTVISHPLSNDRTIPCECMIPQAEDGRLPMILEVMRKAKSSFGQHTALYGLVCGPFTLALHLRGTQVFLDMFEDPNYVKELLDFTRKVCLAMASHYIDAGMDVIAFVDPLVSQISPDHFDEFLSQPYASLFKDIREKKVYSSFFVCGDATKNIEVMCKTGPDSISIDENINIAAAKKITDKYNITIGGNIQLTITMLHGTQQANMKAVVDILDGCGKKNLIVAPGCDMPYDTPIENVIAVSHAVNDYESTKEALKDYSGSLDLSNTVVVIPDYASLKKPLIELFTLDSATCAACGYMMNVVNELHQEAPDLFDWVEYKFTKKENIARCIKVGVKNLPSMYINGTLIYSSLIPSKQDLIAKLSEVRK
jgi:uroporphyrinogen decarboxylase